MGFCVSKEKVIREEDEATNGVPNGVPKTETCHCIKQTITTYHARSNMMDSASHHIF